MKYLCSMDMETIIRDASVEDSDFVAWIVTTALDLPFITPGLLLNCREKDSIYSWIHTRLAVVDGKLAGGLISYEGKDYMRMREKSWPVCWGDEHQQELAAIEQETKAGEYYLDSIAILPEYRGLGIGRLLMLDAMKLAAEKDCHCVTCIAAKRKTGLVEYYKSIGFEPCGEMSFFGHSYWRMSSEAQKN